MSTVITAILYQDKPKLKKASLKSRCRDPWPISEFLYVLQFSCIIMMHSFTFQLIYVRVGGVWQGHHIIEAAWQCSVMIPGVVLNNLQSVSFGSLYGRSNSVLGCGLLGVSQG